jgi:uncharacterized protein (DUF2225 family)
MIVRSEISIKVDLTEERLRKEALGRYNLSYISYYVCARHEKNNIAESALQV